MYDGFVEVCAKSTGEKQQIPPHWLNDPILGRDFELTPTGREQERLTAGPSLDWTLKQLQDHADSLGVDHTGLRSKAQVLTAIEAAPQNVGDPVTGRPGSPAEQSPTPDTPAAGDETQE